VPLEPHPETDAFVAKQNEWLSQTRWQNASLLVPRSLWIGAIEHAQRLEVRHDTMLAELSEWIDALRLILQKAKTKDDPKDPQKEVPRGI